MTLRSLPPQGSASAISPPGQINFAYQVYNKSAYFSSACRLAFSANSYTIAIDSKLEEQKDDCYFQRDATVRRTRAYCH